MLRRIFSLITIFMMPVCIGWSQETRGTISGRVTDSTGALVPNAEVLVVNRAMGTTANLKTNTDGLYSAPLLLPGVYDVTVIASGFKRYTRDNVQLQVADRLEVNIALELGSMDQSVTVAASAELLGTGSASIGNVITTKQIQDLPLSYGNPFQLIGVSSGTSFQGDPRLDRPFEPTHIVGFAIDGTRSGRSDVTLDGAPATATANANQITASYVPLVDILSEFKVQTATFDAAVGNTEGGVTNLNTKSGTNSFHGTAYDSLTRKDLWANDFFNNSLGKQRPDFRFDRWGGSIGGPIWIPKLYNGHNKTFFEVGYEGIHDSRPRYDATTPQVPTPDMKNGDFSALLKLGSQYQIYNPYTRRLVNGRFIEDPFAGNIIPQGLFNPVGKKILDQYYPAPTSPGNPDGSNNLLRPDLAEKAKYYNYSARVDHSISDKQRIYARFSDYRRDSTYNNYFDNLATGTFFQFFAKNGVFDDTYVLSPTTVLDVRYGYNRFIRGSDGNQDSVGFDLTTLGLPASYNAAIPASIRRFPRIDLANYIGTATSGEMRPVDTHSLSGSITKIVGAHSLRAGVDFRAYRENDGFFNNDQTGRFIFDSSYTKGPADNSAASPNSIGQSVAALLLGIPSSSSYVNRSSSYAEQSTTWGFYFHDDWKVTPKLTLNMGLRWEFETALTERYNRSVLSFDPNFVQPFASTAQAAYALNPSGVPATAFNVKGGLTFAGVNGNPAGLYNTPKTNLMPRVGIAYQVTQSTVVRAGFGIFDGFLGARRGDVIQNGFSRQTPFSPFDSNGTQVIATLSNPFPNGILEPVGAAAGPLTAIGQSLAYSVQGQSLAFFNQNPRTPNNYRWQVNVQHQIKGGLLIEAAYVGNKATHLEVVRNINALSNQYLSTLDSRDNTLNSYLTAAVPNPFFGLLPDGTPSGFTGKTIARQQLLLPFPEFGTITTTTNEGSSWYHSLQVRSEKRFSQGLTLVGNYTFSKWMQATELLNAGDLRPTRMISDQDVPHRIAIDWIYQFPFGKGHRILSGVNGFTDRLVNGWEFTGIWAFQSGLPLNFAPGSAAPPSFPGTTNADYFFNGTGNVALTSDQRSLSQWFNTSAFVTAASAQPVSHLRTNPYRFSSVRGPRQNNVDVSLIKDTKIREGQTLRFSVQALNSFNHPLFPAPQLNPISAQFGGISASTQANYPRRLQLELKYMF